MLMSFFKTKGDPKPATRVDDDVRNRDERDEERRSIEERLACVEQQTSEILQRERPARRNER
jgi:hypothetical protein